MSQISEDELLAPVAMDLSLTEEQAGLRPRRAGALVRTGDASTRLARPVGVLAVRQPGCRHDGHRTAAPIRG